MMNFFDLFLPFIPFPLSLFSTFSFKLSIAVLVCVCKDSFKFFPSTTSFAILAIDDKISRPTFLAPLSIDGSACSLNTRTIHLKNF